MTDLVVAIMSNTQEAIETLTRANATSEYDKGYNAAVERIGAMLGVIIEAIAKVEK